MNKVVRQHYPASNLPDDLRGSIARGKQVTVTVEEEDEPDQLMTWEEILAARRPPYRSATEIDEDIRCERNAWED